MTNVFACVRLRSCGASGADALRAGFTKAELFSLDFPLGELWGHDGDVLAEIGQTWKKLKWGLESASYEVETWRGVSQAQEGFVVQLHLSQLQLEGAWQTSRSRTGMELLARVI